MKSSLFRPHLVLLVCFFLLASCNSDAPTASPSLTPQNISPQTAAAPTDSLSPTEQPAMNSVDTENVLIEDDLVHLWALRGSIESAGLVNMATGAPEDDGVCGSPDFSTTSEIAGEVILTLSYAPSLIPRELNIWLEENAEDITRVEILNTTSGLGREIFNASTKYSETMLVDHTCKSILNISIDVDFEVDTVFIAFRSLAAAGRVDAVEIVGSADLYSDAPVFWRMPLQAAPVSVVVDQYNQVFIADELNNIYKYDLEGNLLTEMTVLSEGVISDISIDPDNNLVLSDQFLGTYTIIYPDGEKMIGGGDAPSIEVAIQPDNGKLFLLDDLGDLLYLVPYFPGTDEIINPLPLDDIAYVGLAFSSENRLFTIRPNDGFLAEIDPISGLEINSIPLKKAEYIDATPVEFTIDNSGNFYVLFETNEGNTAIAVLDPDGFLTRRLGTLTEPVNGEWPEGSYYHPKSIDISADGRFALIVDGDDGTYYLTCLLMRED